MDEGGFVKRYPKNREKPPSFEIDRSNQLVHCYMSAWGYLPINPPVYAQDFKCPYCEETRYFLYRVDKETMAWGCGRVCEASKLKKQGTCGDTPVTPQRALLWPLFCEINGIGDVHHDVRFENVHQTKGKLDYMLKFATKPKGIILMRGDPGCGKTYASLAICEFFTRKDTDCIFTTQKQMAANWLDTFKADKVSGYIPRVNNTSLLVVDDFGTADMPSGFMSFFMDLINTRMQWTNRGTVITTNLAVEKFNQFCGEALTDRIMTGQVFEFKGKSRRETTLL